MCECDALRELRKEYRLVNCMEAQLRGVRPRRAYILSLKYWVLQGWASFVTLCSASQRQARSSAVEPVKRQTKVHRPLWQAPTPSVDQIIIRGTFTIAHRLALYHTTTLSSSMSANPRKKSSPFKSALATSQFTQRMPPRQLLPSTPESQSPSPQQQHQAAPDHPWSVLRPTYRSKDVPPSTSGSPFHRYGHTLSITATGELLFFGGFALGVAHGSPRNDLYVFSMRDRSVTSLKTSGEVPSPRGILASVLVSNVLVIFGGATNIDNCGLPTGPYSDSLYLLSLGTLDFFDVETESS